MDVSTGTELHNSAAMYFLVLWGRECLWTFLSWIQRNKSEMAIRRLENRDCGKNWVLLKRWKVSAAGGGHKMDPGAEGITWIRHVK